MRILGMYALATVVGLSAIGFGTTAATAKMSRNDAVKTCVNKAQTQVSTDTEGSGSNARVAVYSSCMRGAGYKP